MTPELHHILAQEQHRELMRAAERFGAAAQADPAGRPARRARLLVRFVPAFMRAAPSETRPARSRWAAARPVEKLDERARV